MKPQFKTPAEMDRIRAADAVLRQKQMRDFKPEPTEYEDGMFLVISRCIKGPQGWVGMFELSKLVMEDEQGKPLKKPIRKVLISGSNRDGINARIDKELGLRYFGVRKHR